MPDQSLNQKFCEMRNKKYYRNLLHIHISDHILQLLNICICKMPFLSFKLLLHSSSHIHGFYIHGFYQPQIKKFGIKSCVTRVLGQRCLTLGVPTNQVQPLAPEKKQKR